MSDRYITRGTLRSTLGGNFVNEFTVGGSGGPTQFSPQINAGQFSGTPVADQSGFLLNINTFGGITNAASTGAYSAREASTKVIENTLNWLQGPAQHPGWRLAGPGRTSGSRTSSTFRR